VPARELSLDEIIAMKQNVDIEIETFIHGAMCYSYSGNCLFSSMLGGRSGNRGRCAQPCRLPYEVKNKKNIKDKIRDKANKSKDKTKDKDASYLLSLKDMCTLSNLPQLIEAGIDSFKIEGRMKKPEYAAGVVALYRYYIDYYFRLKETGREKEYKVSNKDLAQIRTLYMRSEIQNGYYFKQNGAEMVTLEKPNYTGVSEELLLSIRKKYINQMEKIPVKGIISLQVGEALKLTISNDKGHEIQVKGDVVLEAINRPIEEASIRKQMEKTGNSNFEFSLLEIEMVGACFLPIKSLNEIRRTAILEFEDSLLEEYNKTIIISKNNTNILDCKKEFLDLKREKATLVVSVLSWEQFEMVLQEKAITTIYLPIDLLLSKEKRMDKVKRIEGKRIYLVLPHILRKNSYKFLMEMKQYLEITCVQGAIVRNLEEVQWLKTIDFKKEIIADANIYCFNQKSKEWLQQLDIKGTIPYELNKYELETLGYQTLDIIVYGKIPMMVSANCVNKTIKGCQKEESAILKDRIQKEFFVSMNCLHCYNVIYNSVPLSLHHNMRAFSKTKNRLRLDFIDESIEEMHQIIFYFNQLLKEQIDGKIPVYKDYTKGHWKRGVE